MLELINAWKGKVTINGIEYENLAQIPPLSGEVNILLGGEEEKAKIKPNTSLEKPLETAKLYKVSVKQWMTRKSTPDFDWMLKVNNDNPMPLRVMVGEIVRETPKMVYMILHGDILEKRTLCCMKCGKRITNAVSQFFGMGPECGGHAYVNPFASDEELKQAVKDYKTKMQNITWEGWIARSAIEELEVLDAN